MSDARIDLSAQAREMVRAAEERSDFLFLTTFKRYQVQLQLLSGIEKRIRETEGDPDPEDIEAYNRTAAAANRTAAALRKLDIKEEPKGGITGKWEKSGRR